ncbi:short-chain dehydrogenase [Longispora fulva]|uniref:NAD(P)-dependent dehydrogenase (Short-subunit alcohol dehydrogenase family) n=1 Tax=Longispora fulva TaxID=619741 RepID=A0A8J7GBI1_9ACTN|nr:oxidoreductase [Longispora fulva]MBG6135455.1 NAD(P)-dependent dehydrogenase (short-subunit alcohol dehydrogenase family) [Longispora fulva]GIG56303.1 short-chain dehydrogenase [Longispora fulva]
MRARWNVTHIPHQAGRTIVVTGANSGLGYVTTRELARHGGHLIMAVRNVAAGRAARAALLAEVPDAAVDVRHLDLADLDSVRAFADTVERVDVLVNNAGIMMPPRALTPQGHESQFGTNHLGHFALTGLLLGRLRAGRDARVVTVSSSLHRRGAIFWDDLTGARRYSPTAYYAQSKFANVLFGLELDRRLRAAGDAVLSVLAHPGYAATNLQSTGPTGWLRRAMRVSNAVMAQDVATGALSQLYAASDPGAVGGMFIGPAGLGEMRGFPKVVRPVASALSLEEAARLWTVSEELTGVAV